MRLTLHTDLAFRTLMHLGLKPGVRVQTEEIAATWRISANHLDKVVQRLAAGGFIETRRGRGGGMTLARAPGAIRLGAVVRCTEEDLSLVACFGPGGDPCGDVTGERCPVAGACRLQAALGRALMAFLGVLDGMTLADLLDPPAREGALARLGIEAPSALA
ncbi:RrF2 family transcriptional regulator [Roseicella aquatilis]|uniref:Rrf2 family transcriptional regulator n=1 Tax=Roseicella aquatilis TaxID=2527868 RepID=A0A4R4DUB4_9PROT|nr:Rrf2 family transcriptional regulator [Roseicella aquatilis]TCZ66692.1 Rrf2 family transcriptional regulator [Roseicella aquatilis]